jgi:anti-anti-sigma factor
LNVIQLINNTYAFYEKSTGWEAPMRRKVPFLGEENVTRATDEEAQAKKSRGQLIDDVLSTRSQPSTWDDHVAVNYSAPFEAPKAFAPPKTPSPKPSRSKSVPVTSGPVLKKAMFESMYSHANTSAINWLPINSGHGLRINILGSLDQNLRHEWRRLMAETHVNGIGQFEFNFTEAPNLTLTGLGMLLLFKEQKGSERGDIKLCHCNKEVWQMLQWTGMDKYFTILGKPDS